jgi:hypothetical protein
MTSDATIELVIPLQRIERCHGIYDCDGDGRRAEMPIRALWLAPAAAVSYNAHLAEVVTVSDMFRSADSSLAALRAKRGAAAPGRSAHNYGRAIDVDIAATMRKLQLPDKRALDAWLAERGWHCWREDHDARAREAWHYYYGAGPAGYPSPPTYRKGSAVAWWTAEMAATYPVALDVRRRQRALAATGFYSGQLDGIMGPLSRLALSAFARAWGSSDDRTLAFVEWGKAHAPALRAPPPAPGV